MNFKYKIFLDIVFDFWNMIVIYFKLIIFFCKKGEKVKIDMGVLEVKWGVMKFNLGDKRLFFLLYCDLK